jgi:bifunctional non-homologous end joining protein LigD
MLPEGGCHHTLPEMIARKLPAGFIVPAQPIERTVPPAGADWVHEIKHDGYRLIVRKDGADVRLYTRRGFDWTDRFPAIADAASRLKPASFTIDGEAVVIGPDGVARFDELRHGNSQAHLYAFDLVELDGEDLQSRPLLERKDALAHLLRRKKSAILLNEHIAEHGPTVFAHACKLGVEGIVSKRVDSPYRSGRYSAWIKVRNPASIAVQRERSENWNAPDKRRREQTTD